MAGFSLVLWPCIAMALFVATRLQVALVATIIGGFLLLPTATEFDLPIMPALDKHSVPSFAALLSIIAILASSSGKKYLVSGEVLRGWIPRNPVILICLALLILGPLGTVASNREPLIYGPLVLPALQFYDVFAVILDTLTLLLPFFLARKVLASSEGQRVLILGIVLAATGYAFLALYEVRMSPQLNNVVYGFFPHSWLQHIRGDGWRPLVFLIHGLVLGIYLSIAFIIAVGLARNSTGKMRLIWILVAAWLFGTLILAKSVGAVLIAIVMAGITLFLPRRLQILATVVIALCVLIYPVLRANDLVPVDRILEITEGISAERAQSFGFRLENEQLLLDKANERPLFGWGGWGRGMVFSPESGRELTTPDGIWIIVFGAGGWLRYFGTFGLLTWGLVALFREKKSKLDPATVTLALALAGNLVDLLPNSGATPVTWMMAGALCGRLERREVADGEIAPSTEVPDRNLSYSREYSSIDRSAVDPREDGRRKQATVDRETLPYRRKF